MPRSDPDKIDVNARCLDGIDLAALTLKQFDGQQLGDAMQKKRAVAMSALDGEIRDGRHVMSVRVYYEDTDFSGIVYHANYLRFMERGRTNYLRLLGADQRALFEEAEQEAPGFAFVVRAMQIEFLQARAHGRRARGRDDPPTRCRAHRSCCTSRSCATTTSWSRRRCKVAFVSGGRARPIPKALRTAMQADQERASRPDRGGCRRGAVDAARRAHVKTTSHELV